MDYIAYLRKERDSDFGVSFPDFPGCITAGKTLEEAHRMAGEALALHIAGMVEDGEAIPEPSTLDALAEDPARKDAVVFLVHAEPQMERRRQDRTLTQWPDRREARRDLSTPQGLHFVNSLLRSR